MDSLNTVTDDSEIPAPALDKFMKRFDSSVPQLHPHLDRMVATLRGMSEYFPPLGVKAIIQSTVEYVNACALEPVAEKMPIHPAALSYVIARRTKHGVAEPYAAYIFPKVDFPDVLKWLQPMPDIMIFISWTNDVLSLHKEELANDTHKQIHERAQVTGRDLIQVISDVTDEAVTACQKVRLILQNKKERDAWESFVAGYVAWHRYTPRYRLNELLGDDGHDVD